MPEVPAALRNCSTDEYIAALLYLGWTHEEIAAATNVSKGTVQNRRKQLEGGNLHPPPEAFDLIWKRERELHRVARNSNLSAAGLGTEVADRMKTIADLDVLDIGPDGDISYEDLVAFAVLIAGQVDDFTPQEVVKRLTSMAILVDNPSNLSERVTNSSKLPQTEAPEVKNEVPEKSLLADNDLVHPQPSIENSLEEPTSNSKDTREEQPWFSQNSKHSEHELPYKFQADNEEFKPSANFSHNEGKVLHSINREECRGLGGHYDEERRVCVIDWYKNY